jgi:hypothetical protein
VIRPVDDEAPLVAIVLESVEADALVGPVQVQFEDEVLDGVAPPGEILGDTPKVSGVPVQRRRDAHDRIFPGDLVLLVGAEPNEAHHDGHRDHDQERDRQNDRVDDPAAVRCRHQNYEPLPPRREPGCRVS